MAGCSPNLFFSVWQRSFTQYGNLRKVKQYQWAFPCGSFSCFGIGAFSQHISADPGLLSMRTWANLALEQPASKGEDSRGVSLEPVLDMGVVGSEASFPSSVTQSPMLRRALCLVWCLWSASWDFLILFELEFCKWSLMGQWSMRRCRRDRLFLSALTVLLPLSIWTSTWFGCAKKAVSFWEASPTQEPYHTLSH